MHSGPVRAPKPTPLAALSPNFYVAQIFVINVDGRERGSSRQIDDDVLGLVLSLNDLP